LCGHYEVVQLLLESGALCERDTFQGERCLYNALNNRIRNLLLQYDYSKSTDPLQPFASHISSLLTQTSLNTSDISLHTASASWNLHKFILSARSSYFSKKLSTAPESTTWKLASIPSEVYQVAIQFLYLGAVPSDLGFNTETSVNLDIVLTGIDKVSKLLGIETLWESILSGNDKRLARQRHQDEVSAGRDQIENWYRENVLKHKLVVDKSKAQDVKWTRDNGIFADVLLRADELADEDDDEPNSGQETPIARNRLGPLNGIPIGPSRPSRSPSRSRNPKKSVLFPVHRAMMVRSEYFKTMFTSDFQEAQLTEYLQIIPVDCSPEVLEIVLNFLYTEKTDIPIELALDVLFAADMLFIEKLKTKAANVISTVGHGPTGLSDRTHNETEELEVEPVNVYDVIRAGWLLKIQRLEEFSARYLAYRLEDYIDEEDFEELIQESASRVEKRQETDTIELLDEYVHQSKPNILLTDDVAIVSGSTYPSDFACVSKTPDSKKSWMKMGRSTLRLRRPSQKIPHLKMKRSMWTRPDKRI
jgi:ankyrin repeat/BTB/POZ domain-containing protein 1